ncbi:MAG: hypothetical protein LBD75_07610 [Candidatus Peribacteria bacterium]|nr:hypothetical protein [Candidatus Peribacteria bacterium]
MIFILILLGITFFIYGLFSPSGAGKLRYYVKTFPQKVASLFGGDPYLSYDEFQLLPSIENPVVVTPSLNTPLPSSGTEQPKEEKNSSPSQLLNQIQNILQPATSSSVPIQPSESVQSVSASVDSSSQPFTGSSEPTQSPSEPVEIPSEPVEVPSELVEVPSEPVEIPSELVEIPSKPVGNSPVPPSSSSVQQTVNGLTAQEIREAETIFGMLLGK